MLEPQIGDDAMSLQSQRIDKWLWYSRLIKTRTQASRLIVAGKIRLNRVRVQKPATGLRVGDIVTAVIGGNVRVAKILDLGRRRGPAADALLLYEDLTPDPKSVTQSSTVLSVKAPTRDKGMGRPTKRDRRKMDDFRDTAQFVDK